MTLLSFALWFAGRLCAQTPEAPSKTEPVLVTLEAPGTVLLKTSWHPLWHAYVDGQRVPTALLSPGFIGVDLPAGRHALRLAYEILAEVVRELA